MADKKSTSSKVKATIADNIVEPAKAAGEKIRASGAKMAEGGATMSMKMIDHAEENAREAFAAMRAAAKAKDVADVMKVQGEYLRTQGTRSMNHARDISDLIAAFGREAIAPLKRGKKD